VAEKRLAVPEGAVAVREAREDGVVELWACAGGRESVRA
jgi:hypothetical protein